MYHPFFLTSKSAYSNIGLPICLVLTLLSYNKLWYYITYVNYYSQFSKGIIEEYRYNGQCIENESEDKVDYIHNKRIHLLTSLAARNGG